MLTQSAGSARLCALAFNSTGSHLASVSKNGAVCVWKFSSSSSSSSSSSESLRLVSELKERGCKDYAYTVAWSPTNPALVAAAYADTTVRVWNVTKEECVLSLKPPSPKQILCMAWSPDGKQLGIGSEDDSFALVDAATGAELGKHSCKPAQLDEFQWSGHPEFIFTTTRKRDRGFLSVAKLASEPHFQLQPIQSCGAYSGVAVVLVTDKARKRLALSADDTVVSIWNARDLTCTASLDRFDHAPTSLSFSSEGRFLASAFTFKPAAGTAGAAAGLGSSRDAGAEAFVDIADASSGRRLGLVKVGVREIIMLCWHPTKNVLAFCASAGMIGVVTF